MAKRPQPARYEWERWAPFAALAVLTGFAFANATPDTLVLDDKILVPASFSWSRLWQLFGEDVWRPAGVASDIFRPVAMSTIHIDRALHPTSDQGLHVTNVLLQIACTLAVYLLTLLLLRDRGARPGAAARWPAFVAALAFGLHPIHTDAVDSVINRAEILSTLGVVAAIAVLWRWSETRPRLAWGTAAAIYLVALLCKESAATLPFLALLTLELFREPADWRTRLRRCKPALVLLVPLALYLALRLPAIPDPRAGSPHTLAKVSIASWSDRGGVVASMLAGCWRMLIWPHPLRASYDDFVPHGVGLALGIHAVLLAAAVACRRRAPAVTLAIGFFYVALLPSTRLLSRHGFIPAPAERYVYLPSAGMAVALGFGLAIIARRLGWQALAAAAVVLFVGVMPLTRARNLDWQSDRALWEAEIRAAPENGDAWMHLTTEYLRRGMDAQVVAACDAQLARHPDHTQFHNNCASANANVGNNRQAETLYHRAIDLGAGAMGHANLARLLMKLRRTSEAEVEFQRAADTETNPVMQHVRRGQMLITVHPERAAEARTELETALAMQPGFGPALQWMARLRQTQPRR